MEILSSILILILLIVAVMNDVYQQRLGVSPMPTMPKTRRAMLEMVPQGNGRIVELGSGWGGISFAVARQFPHRQITGIEYSIIPYLFSRARKFFNPSLKNLNFQRQNFFETPLHDVAAVLCYLSNPLMAQLRDKLKNQLPHGAAIISSTFFIPDWPVKEERLVTGVYNVHVFLYVKS